MDSNEMQVDSDDSVEEVQVQPENSSKPEKKRRKLRSAIWEDFPRLTTKPGEPLMCACKKCGKKYSAESGSGTGNLIRHRKKCSLTTTKDIGQYMISSDSGVLKTRKSEFSQEKFRELLVQAIVRHDLSFSFSQYEAVRNVFKYLEPDVKPISRNTTKSDVIKLYESERKRLRAELSRSPSRIALTSDAWTSIVTDGYISLTAHYVDSDWVLQKRILNFSYMPPPHTGVALAEKISGLVKGWGIEKKLFSITLDNASANDVCANVLKTQYSLIDSLVCKGKLFHVRCCCHVLNLIVQDGLKEIDVAVEKIRISVKSIKGSGWKRERFKQSCLESSLDVNEGLMHDCPTRWNSTYRMLNTALYYRRALCHLSIIDTSFQTCPTPEEWVRVEKICSFLGVFYDATLEFSGTLYPTSNLYFPKVFEIHLKLVNEMKSKDDYMKHIANQMWLKFQKYWADFSLLLAVAVVFDPRYKYLFLEFSYSKLYGETSQQLKEVKQTLEDLFDEYMLASKDSTSSASCARGTEQESLGDPGNNQSIYKEFDDFDCDESSGSKPLTQLQLYLAEPRLKRTTKINILDFWKAQKFRYPELARLAMDLISVPISTVASESAFSLGGRVLDQYRSSMKPATAEALICTRDWLFGENVTSEVDLEELTQSVMTLDFNKDGLEEGSNSAR